MSTCVREYIEKFLFTKRNTAKEILSQIKSIALANLNMQLFNQLSTLENEIEMLIPLKTLYTSQAEYIKALKAHALITSFITELITKTTTNEISPEQLVQTSNNLISLVKGTLSLDLGGIITRCHEILSKLEKIGPEIYLEGSRKYLVSIIEPCGYKDLSKEELHLIKDYIITQIKHAQQPYLTIEQLSLPLGLREKIVADMLKDLTKMYPDIIYKQKFVTTHEKITTYMNQLIQQKETEEHIRELVQVFPEELEKAYYKNLLNLTKQIEKILAH